MREKNALQLTIHQTNLKDFSASKSQVNNKQTLQLADVCTFQPRVLHFTNTVGSIHVDHHHRSPKLQTSMGTKDKFCYEKRETNRSTTCFLTIQQRSWCK